MHPATNGFPLVRKAIRLEQQRACLYAHFHKVFYIYVYLDIKEKIKMTFSSGNQHSSDRTRD